MRKTTKISLNLPGILIEKIKETAAKEARSMTDIIRRGVETQFFIDGEVLAGAKVVLVKKDGTTIELYHPDIPLR